MTKILRHSLRAAALGAVLAIAGLSTVRADEPAPPLKPAISDDAASAISQMAGTLSARDLSVTVRTIRVYLDESGQSLHIFHTLHIVARRPDQIAVEFNGDDGKQQLFYDGKAAAVFLPDSNQYTVMPASGSISSVVAEAADKLNVDFPLAALFAESPDKVLLGDAMAARQVGTATVDGVECRHLFFSQKSGIDIELWVEKNDAATPHRLTVTYRLLPGQPSFIAEFMDWNTKANPSDSEFVFQPPSDAKKIELNQAAAPTTEDAK
ncbi:DUF2092 domain-containing protein [Rhizobium calliandrae]|uniref:DUF2092 domain-containing protein n=1 Tax=Rhizobium calliandrae TaxID=1312182 RepID=A0ABT7KPL1_9HYPH|nr:DUF2092 domain-containing protein [Rhizobium calliandrae]MDL2410564.1 DUF2092 domain-containing protein [Rhizobium calliandrae]